ncbi:hypothetical protein OIU78_019049 [Salix suchowensis]|nr:hypothetical protein OIU78_019049 [Salix suchowensis]
MGEIYRGVVSESEAWSTSCRPSSRIARRRRMEIRRLKFVAGVASTETGADGMGTHKKQKLQVYSSTRSGTDSSPCSRDCQNAVENCDQFPKFGVTSVCGRRRDMEDAVAIHPSFCRKDQETTTGLHFFGVYDGHGCSHVAVKCKERLHELVKEELGIKQEWKSAAERSFRRMDREVVAWNQGMEVRANCKCEMQTPECDTVGSAAVVSVVTPDKIIVANCGDSRAVLCRNGKPLPLSSDHKPDRPDELNRIENAGGRVIYWDCPRVLGVLAMSRAIGDNYLKPYVSCEPEGKRHAQSPRSPRLAENNDDVGITASSSGIGEMSDKACSEASMLLTKMALARHSTDNVSVVVVNLRKDT